MRDIRKPICLVFISIALLASCSQSPSAGSSIEDAAEEFVRLALEFDEYDPLYVDSYTGPAEWVEDAKQNLRPKADLATAIGQLLTKLEAAAPSTTEEVIRHRSLLAKVRALDVRIRILNGETFSFAEEAFLLFGINVPAYDFSKFDKILDELDKAVPGSGSLHSRIDQAYDAAFIPEDKVLLVFERALKECRQRTLQHIDLPTTEQIQLEFDDEVWGAMQEYLGDTISRIQVGQASTLTAGGAVNLACHEGYPGHHVQMVLLDQHYLKDRLWKEHYVYPLHSPAALIIEGGAMFAPVLAFPGDELYEFQRDVLAPLAGLDADNLRLLDKLDAVRIQLGGAQVAIVQLYLDGDISREEAIEKLERYVFMGRAAAEKSLGFYDEYRSYIVNYTIGAAAVAAYVESNSSTESERWAAYQRLIMEQVFPD